MSLSTLDVMTPLSSVHSKTCSFLMYNKLNSSYSFCKIQGNRISAVVRRMYV